jgi:hypothetical protein
MLDLCTGARLAGNFAFLETFLNVRRGVGENATLPDAGN